MGFGAIAANYRLLRRHTVAKVTCMTRRSPTGASRRRGRPTASTREQALDASMRLFWERGYEGTSFAELVAEMRIGHATFYSAFGSTEELYREATERYVTEYVSRISRNARRNASRSNTRSFVCRDLMQ